MNYKTLCQESIRQLERLNGGAWTDFNAHDPGITLLEQLCYGLTDLSYRIGHPIPDLLAEGGSDPFASLHPAHEILPCAPVTLADLRRVVLDVEGIRNAWVELIPQGPGMQSPSTFYLGDGTDYSLYVGTADGSSGVPASAVPLYPRGLHRVLLHVEGSQNANGGLEIRRKIADRLHAMRPLGEDVPVVEIQVVKTQWIQVAATIDVDAVDDLPSLAAEVRRVLDDEISPTVRFSSLADLLESGQSLEQIFDGPRLSHGFLTEEALRRSVREPVIHPSDLMRRIMDVPGVRAVSRIQVRNATDQSTANTDGKWEDYSLPVKVGSIARLASEFSAIKFRCEGRSLPFPNDRKAEEATGEVGSSATDVLVIPSGRSRNVVHYTSVQQHLPAIYGVGDHSPSDAATPERRAQARQLQAYLLFFDQLMANDFAQLGHLKNLLGFASADPSTYVSQRVEAAGGSDLLSKDDVWLQDCVESVEAGLQRKQRLLKHLLARFAEEPELPEAHIDGQLAESAQDHISTVPSMQMWLRNYPHLSGARGVGANYLVSTSRSVLEERLQLLLGCGPDDLFVVEHLLLRPLMEDAFPVEDDPPLSAEIPLPLLADSTQPDPYSFQLSIVLRTAKIFEPTVPSSDKSQIERRLRMETPAHLSPRFVWMDDERLWPPIYDESPSSLGAYQRWRSRLQKYTMARMASSQIPLQDTLQLRATRDLLIDLLKIGKTYPLREVELAAQKVVAGEHGQVTITPSQIDVTYELYFDVETTSAGEPQPGNGETLTLTTKDELLNARTFAVKATKTDAVKATKTDTDRWTYLRSKITIPVGLNFQLAATIEPTLVDYGGSVTVTVKNSQAGVSYSLWTGETETQLQAIPGARKDGEREKDISIIASSMLDDVTIWIRVERTLDSTDCGFLTTRLPLAVRANPDLGVTLRELIIDHEAFATIQIAGTQKNVTYSPYVRDLHDTDFAPDTDRSLRFVGTAQEPARVWDAGTVYRAVNPVGSGTGPATPPLSLTLQEALTEDCLIAVRAQKTHTSKLPNQPPTQFTSDVQLRTMVYVLVRPDKRNSPPNKLSLRVKDRCLTVSGGQPGVFYSIFPDGISKDPLSEPAYFHKRDDHDAQKNKGIGQLWVGTDLVVVGEVDGNATTDPANLHPKDPTLDLKTALSAGSVHVMAKKARTGVEWTTRQVFPVDKANGPTPS